MNVIRRLLQRGAGEEATSDRLALMEQRLEQMQALQQELLKQSNRHIQELWNANRRLENALKKEVSNGTQQLEAFINLQALWNPGQAMVPMLHGWPVSADLAMQLIQLLESENYDQIIEFGSGSSTLVFAKQVQRMTQAGTLQNPCAILSFDHLPEYFRKTAQLLKRNGVSELVKLYLAPLTAYSAVDGSCYQYYDCGDALAAAALALPSVNSKVLVLVDGPPALTGPRARYPAMPQVLKHFAFAEIHLLMDDYQRQDEQDIVETWQVELKRDRREFSSVELPLEKGASLLKIVPVPVVETRP